MVFLKEHPLYNLKYAESSVPFVIKDTCKMVKSSEQPHRHSYYTLIWSYGAFGKQIIDYNEYAFAPGNLFLINPGQVHQIISNPKPEGVLLILFTPEFLFEKQGTLLQKLDIFVQNQLNLPLSLQPEQTKQLEYHTTEMLTAFYSDDKWKYEFIEAHLKLFLIELNKQYLTHFIPGNSIGNETIHRLASSFKILVEEHCHEWHQVQSYADNLNVTPNYLGEVMRQSFHVSPKEYISQQIVAEAKRLVVYSGGTLKEIGYRLGFEDPNRFSRFFRDIAGISFQNFRNSLG